MAPVPLPDTGQPEGSRVSSAGGQTVLEVCPHRGPLVVEDAVPGAVAALATAHEHVLAVDSLEGCAERLERPPSAFVERVRLELDPSAAQHFEGMLELQQLGLDVRSRA